jgi:hypothetical protein
MLRKKARRQKLRGRGPSRRQITAIYGAINIDEFVKSPKSALTTFRRNSEYCNCKALWMPDQVRHDDLKTFYEFINIGSETD